jgi:hypothetical protein
MPTEYIQIRSQKFVTSEAEAISLWKAQLAEWP